MVVYVPEYPFEQYSFRQPYIYGIEVAPKVDVTGAEMPGDVLDIQLNDVFQLFIDGQRLEAYVLKGFQKAVPLLLFLQYVQEIIYCGGEPEEMKVVTFLP